MASIAPFRVIDDGVMGGVSAGRLHHADRSLVFEGIVSLAHGGGFSSFRGPLSIPPDTTAIDLRCRGDGQRYRLSLRTGDPEQGQNYQAPFTTSGHWKWLRFTAGDFTARLRGRAVAAPPLAFDETAAFGILIADRQAGSFRLEIRELRTA